MNTKNLLIALLGIFLGGSIHAQESVLDQFFDQHRDDTAFTVINISPKMFQMIAGSDENNRDDDEVTSLIKSITGLRILIKENGDGTQLFAEAFGKIAKHGFEELLTVKDKGENIRFMVREGATDNIINQLVLLVGGADNFVLMDLTGNINLRTIGKLSKSMDLPGAEHLQKLE